MTNKKTYILDTNVLIDDPTILNHLQERSFEDANIVLPVTVLDELDKLKKQTGEAGKKARLAVRSLDKLSDEGEIHKGIELPGNNSLRVDIVDYDNKAFGDPLYGDVRIIALANHYTHSMGLDCTLLTNDVNMRVRAKAHNIKCTSYNKDKAEAIHIETYAGYRDIEDSLMLEKIVNEGYVDPRNFDIHDLHPNEGVFLKDAFGETQALARMYSEDSLELVKNKVCFGVSPKNNEQALAMNLILDKQIQLVTLSGMPGTGKSLICIATALELVMERHEFQKLIIYRPMNVISGQDIGYLPGDMNEKIAQNFGAIFDSFEYLMSKKAKKAGKNLPPNNRWKEELKTWQDKGIVEFSPITYVRGRSITNALILVDEIQNFTKEDAKTLLTRVGEGSKVICTGDLEQIDTIGLDPTNNALIHIIDHFKDSNLAGHVTLIEGQRSALAKEAALYL